MNEVQEITRLNRLIRQFEVVRRSTTDEFQRRRVTEELQQLTDYRDKFLALHEVDQSLLDEPAVEEALAGFPILRDLTQQEHDQVDPHDEVGNLQRYMQCFYDEFMIFLTPKKLRLDAKYSMVRDRFYSDYHELLRQMKDCAADRDSSPELVQKANYHRGTAAEIRTRSLRLRTNLLITAARYFSGVRDFCSEILEDLDGGGAICKNGDEVLTFSDLKGIHYVNGLSVWHALQLLLSLSKEILRYLNVPEAPQR